MYDIHRMAAAAFRALLDGAPPDPHMATRLGVWHEHYTTLAHAHAAGGTSGAAAVFTALLRIDLGLARLMTGQLDSQPLLSPPDLSGDPLADEPADHPPPLEAPEGYDDPVAQTCAAGHDRSDDLDADAPPPIDPGPIDDLSAAAPELALLPTIESSRCKAPVSAGASQVMQPARTHDLAECPLLPASAELPSDLGEGVCPWLDEYLTFSHTWAPRAWA